MPCWAVLTVCPVMMSVADYYCDFTFAHLRHTFSFFIDIPRIFGCCNSMSKAIYGFAGNALVCFNHL